MVANTNRFCGFGMGLVGGFLRLASVPIWFMLWNGNYLAGSAPGDAQEVMASVSNVPVREGYEMVSTKGPGEY